MVSCNIRLFGTFFTELKVIGDIWGFEIFRTEHSFLPVMIKHASTEQVEEILQESIFNQSKQIADS